MKFLLDVNALVAWHHVNAQDHTPFHAWRAAHPSARLATCAVVELGFLRVSMAAFRYNAAQAAAALAQLKNEIPEFISELPPPKLASWANTHARTTDAYLAQVAALHGAKLATFDTGIPGAALL